jgi:predicted NUDIX family NTP pyrophosphohydrolase
MVAAVSPSAPPRRATGRSAGLLLHRLRAGEREVLLVHPGGPFWARREAGAWSIPKGEHTAEEPPEQAARREFSEELGAPVPEGEWRDLGEVRQRSGKWVRAWAVEGQFDVSRIVSNQFEIEWPPRSGRTGRFPEVDRAEWLDLAAARERINPSQAAFLDRLVELLHGSAPG